MDFLSKCNILGELWLKYRDEAETNETWSEYFTYSDVALPLSYGISQGFVQMVEGGGLDNFVNESWQIFCELIDIDPDGEYEDIEDAWAASPNPPLNDE